MPTRRSAASTAFRNSIAIVVGPTPPTRGVIQPATSAHASSTSGSSLRPFVRTPPPTTTAPGRMCSGCRIAGHAGRGHDDVGPLGVPRPIWYAGVHDRDRRVGGRPLLREQERERPAEREAAPEDHDLATRDRDLVVREQRLDAGGRARNRPGDTEHEPAEVHRVQPVDVLVGIDLEQRGLVVDLRRRRVLHEHRVDGGIVVERADRREQIGLRRVLGQVHVRRA